ncbi:PASTA domain-containing protein [Actinoplanes sp. NEAU-A12]|uniref:PASTA domain-containing protein n=2 Tax=Actinoplanes sandaracinus TaxID=3045177 RepID=A0ABT6WTC1_9ACTN|nr:PASTA domain-containing protein [Actinoplanes sandaracinus]MDI6102934.1 PASTA domain-containing protein [Actinoplanes sandaracinus]
MAEERDPDPVDDRPESDDRDVWTGRAGVRPYGAVPRNPYDEDSDWTDPGQAEPSGRWWAPIAVGTVALVLVGLLAVGIAVIVRNTGGDAETPGDTPPATRLTNGPDPGVTTPGTGATATTPTTEPSDQEVNVPALRGMPLADAQAALARSGLKWRVIRRESDAEPDTVINCDPAEGQQVPSDTRVTLIVAVARQGTPTTPPAAVPSASASG